MAKRRDLPPIPRDASPELRKWLESIKEITDTSEGTRGNPLDRKLTVRDLIDSGIGALRGSIAGRFIGGGQLQPGGERINRTVPPRPEQVLVVPVLNAIVISMNNPNRQYGNHAYGEIWRAEGLAATLDTAIRIGTFAGSSYTDYTVGQGEPFTYWVRFVSQADVNGPYHSPTGSNITSIISAKNILSTLNEELGEATTGTTSEDFVIAAARFAIRTTSAGDEVIPFAVMDVDGVPTVVMQNVQIDEGILGPISFGKLVQDDGNGNLVSVTTVGGKLKADYIDAQNLSVAEAATAQTLAVTGTVTIGQVTDAGALASEDSVDYSGVTGTKPPSDADKTSSNTAAGITNQGSLATKNKANYDTDVDGTKPPSDADNTQSAINTTITMTSGTIRAGKSSVNDTSGTGYALGFFGSSPRLIVGNSTNYMRWNGTSLIARGDILATSVTADTITTANLVAGSTSRQATQTLSSRSTNTITLTLDVVLPLSSSTWRAEGYFWGRLNGGISLSSSPAQHLIQVRFRVGSTYGAWQTVVGELWDNETGGSNDNRDKIGQGTFESEAGSIPADVNQMQARLIAAEATSASNVGTKDFRRRLTLQAFFR